MANPNPSPETRFAPGQTGNPGGKTSKHRKAEIEAAELAATVRLELVRAVAEAIEGASSEEKQMQIRSDVLNLLKQSEDRAHGTPKQTIEQDTTMREVPKGMDAFYASQSAPADSQDDD
jgi:hypothetical protein